MSNRNAISQKFQAYTSADEDAYLAGFFDGEGSIVFHAPPGARLIVQVGNCDPRPLRRFQKAYGGEVQGPYFPKRESHSKYWRWAATNHRNMHYALSRMYPWLIIKRYKAGWAIHALNFLPGRRGVNLSARQQREVKQAHTQFYRKGRHGVI